jgi:hypothetical protein
VRDVQKSLVTYTAVVNRSILHEEIEKVRRGRGTITGNIDQMQKNSFPFN